MSTPRAVRNRSWVPWERRSRSRRRRGRDRAAASSGEHRVISFRLPQLDGNACRSDASRCSILEKLGIDGGARDSRQLVLKGGPVERDRGYVLHSDDYEVEGSTLEVSDGLCLTATREILQTLTVGHELPSRAVLALGYAGWQAGQLEMELRENVWLTGPADPDLVFDADHATKWERALARMGVSSAMLSGQAGRA